ncbi:MAG TPA: glycosyl hydrolase, partial [Verrucomicrobiae bacterium]|nr:glycosyl hydrolase [Verrucomicrobiae bacterium]
GAHWSDLTRAPGFPAAPLGRMGVAVAPSNPRIVYAIAQAKEGGIFRSDDGGASWKRVNDQMELRQRAFYYMTIYVDPANPDVVYVPNVLGLWKSVDGAKTFTALHTPHGDNHIVWINPRDPKILLEGNDGGATVSTDGGQTWSTVWNQPTGQFYHVALDDRFPFHVYGAQQDEGSFEGPSASSNGAIALGDWQRVAYGESTFVAPQPGNPDITYGSGYFSIFLQYDAATGQFRSVSPYPDYQEGAASDELKYRFGWTHPVMFSPADHKTLLIASQYVLRSDDGGLTWQQISPDLTRNDKATEAPTGGPVDLDQTSAEVYPDVSSLAVSPLDGDVMWAGSADGLVHVTTDGGAQWTAVTPPSLPQTAQISSIEASHVAKGTAYLTASRYMWDDFHPYVYETTDYGAHWTTIDAGLPADQYAFAIRQDPSEANLLFLGTKNTVYVSLDGGALWSPLSLNLPKVQVRDLAIDSRQGEVVAATHGRAFWILDDLALLEGLSKSSGAAASGGAQVFAPQSAWLTHAYGASDYPLPDVGSNPPFGATVFFNVPSSYDGKTPATLTFSDASGSVVRSFTLHLKSKPPKSYLTHTAQYDPAGRARIEAQLHTGITAGMNRFQWDLRYPDATAVTGFEAPVAAGGEDDSVAGPTVLPGTYTVTLDYGGSKTSAPLTVALDPRLNASAEALADRLALQQKIHASLDALDRAIDAAIAARDRLHAALAAHRIGAAAARPGLDALDAAIGEAVQLGSRSSEGTLLREAKLHSRLAYLAADVELAYDKPTAAQYTVYGVLAAKAQDEIAALRSAAALAEKP